MDQQFSRVSLDEATNESSDELALHTLSFSALTVEKIISKRHDAV